MSNNCDQLHDYMAGALDANQAQAFRTHLGDCPACREELRCQETIDALLRQATSCETPRGLLLRLDQTIEASAQRRRLAVITSLAIAASLALVLVVRQPSEPRVRPTTQMNVVKGPMSTSGVSLVLDSRSEFLAVPQESGHPNVTIFWLYPTVKTAAPSVPPDVATPTGSES